MPYPTKKEILEALKTTYVDDYIDIVKEWKKYYYTKQWKSLSTYNKFKALVQLCNLVYKNHNNQIINVIGNTEYAYNRSTNTILLGPTPSIISTLHELGHAILGYKEIDACRFSVKIFQTVFPREYKKLTWKGHMLTRK